MKLLSLEKLPSQRGLRKSLLVASTIGIDASTVFEMLMMIANIQTLGVPVRFASYPGTAGAVLAAVLIPAGGLILDFRPLSKFANGVIVFVTSCLQIFGTLLVFIANMVKLFYNDNSTKFVKNEPLSESDHRNNLSLSRSVTSVKTRVDFNNSLFVYEGSNFTYKNNITGSYSLPFNHTDNEAPSDIKFYAIVAMIGFGLIDSGYDASTCFVKSFAVALTPSKEHSSIIFRSILISSIGGCLIAVLGSIGLGNMMTAGTLYDSNSAQCALLSGLCFLLMIIGVTSTLTTGFCCPPINEHGTPLSESEKESSKTNGDISSQNDTVTEKTKLSANTIDHYNGIVLESQPCKITNGKLHENSHIGATERLLLATKKWKKLIMLNISTFFLIGAVYSFAIYGVNYLGIIIFNGDPLADVNSQAYKNYLKGIEAGSIGHLTYYGACSVFNVFNERIINRFGWKLEIVVTSLLFAACGITCALTRVLWTYYLCSVVAGFYRSMVSTIPYILANQFTLEKKDNSSSAIAMTSIASMLPLNFIICSAIMGPLIDVTDAASPFYYTAFCALLGMCFSVFIE